MILTLFILINLKNPNSENEEIMKNKIPYNNIFNQAKNAVSNDLPFDREEIRNLLVDVNPIEYSSKYHNLFKHNRRFYMTALTSTLIIISFLVFNMLSPFQGKQANKTQNKLLASNEKFGPTTEKAKSNIIVNEKVNVNYDDKNSENKIENITKVQSDSNAKNDDDDCSGGTFYIKGVVRHDTTNDWRKITYNVGDNDRFTMIKTIYFEADSGKEQAIQYYDALTFEQVLFYYKLLYNDLKSVDTPNLDLIGYAKDESEYNKLYKESDGYLNWKTKNTELR